jgi:hypothetical protein
LNPSFPPWVPLAQVWLKDCRASFSALTREKVTREAAEAKANESRTASQADDLIDFMQLKVRHKLNVNCRDGRGDREGGEGLEALWTREPAGGGTCR